MADSPLIHPILSYEGIGMPCHTVRPNRHQPQQFNNYGQKAKLDLQVINGLYFVTAETAKNFNHKTLFFCLKTVFIMSSAISHSIILS